VPAKIASRLSYGFQEDFVTGRQHSGRGGSQDATPFRIPNQLGQEVRLCGRRDGGRGRGGWLLHVQRRSRCLSRTVVAELVFVCVCVRARAVGRGVTAVAAVIEAEIAAVMMIIMTSLSSQPSSPSAAYPGDPILHHKVRRHITTLQAIFRRGGAALRSGQARRRRYVDISSRPAYRNGKTADLHCWGVIVTNRRFACGSGAAVASSPVPVDNGAFSTRHNKRLCLVGEDCPLFWG